MLGGVTLVFWFSVFSLYHLFVAVFAAAPGVPGLILGLMVSFFWALLFDTTLRISGPHKAGRLLRALLMGGLGLFLLVAFGFARLYERPFSWAFVRTDTLSIWRENFVSALYEIGLPHLVFMLGIGLLFLLIARDRNTLPFRRAAVRLGVGVGGVIASLIWQPYAADLGANPVTAAFARPAKATRDAQVVGDDLVPGLDGFPLGERRIYPAVAAAPGQKKNVILYFLESTPHSVVGQKIGGREVTPNLNRLREKSVYFNRHYANFPLSINALYNVLCSAYALPDGAWISLALPDFSVPCLSQILKRRGYRTIALHAGYLGYAKQKRFMQQRSFDVMLDADSVKKPPYEEGMGPWGAADERALIAPLTEFVAADPEKPVFAVIFAFAPHHPYNKPDGFPDFITERGDLKKQQVNFFNSLHFADHAFGEIFAALEKKGILRDSILMAFGDHGEAFYQHRGNYNHPFFLYEENVHVPLFLYFDGVRPASVDRVTSHVDILPSVLDLLGFKDDLSPMHAGRSMLKGGSTVAHLQAYWQEEYSGIVGDRFKFIRKDTGALELYDLGADAAEKHNLAEQQPEIAAVYEAATQRAFAQKKAYYKKYGNYDLVRFNPASQDK